MTASNSNFVFLLAILALLSSVGSDYCEKDPFKSYPYCDYKQPIADRVKDLLGRISITDKVSQLGHGAGAITSLDIPAYQWWSECLHGIASSPGVTFGGILPYATSFPQVITTASSFNSSLFFAIGNVTSTEARAFANNNQSGLTFFAPNINIVRDPRWGRGQETPGEDPYLSSQYAINFVSGLQGPTDDQNNKYMKTVATCKHYAAYDLENYFAVKRHSFNAIVSKQDLEETYFPAFRACVQGGKVGSIMCSYNAVNGVPSCANNEINNLITRNQWGFDGYIVSDCGAINDINIPHHYVSTPSEAAAAGIKGGCDLNCGSSYQKNMMDAYNAKNVTDDDINLALTRLFTYRMRLGMFDPPEMQPYRSYTADMVNTKEHQQLALNAARESIVLLQNNDGTLPLSTSVHANIAVVGPHGMATGVMHSNYCGKAPYLISPLDGFKNITGIKNASYSQGCDVNCYDTSGFNDAITMAASCDAVIAIMGLNLSYESEGNDRADLFLPNLQDVFLKDLKAALPSKVPLVVVIMSGSSVDLTTAKSVADALLWAGYPGQSGGQAIAEIVYGQVNPSGRLPITFYSGDYFHMIPYLNMSMRVPPGRSYKFYTGTPVFPFGHGLSYTTFTMKWSKPPNASHLFTHSMTDPVSFEVSVTNDGKMGGAISVLAFVSSSIPGAPLKELFAFQKIFLQAGEKGKLSFTAEPNAFSTVDENGQRSVKAGQYMINIGDQLSYNVTISSGTKEHTGTMRKGYL